MITEKKKSKKKEANTSIERKKKKKSKNRQANTLIEKEKKKSQHGEI